MCRTMKTALTKMFAAATAAFFGLAVGCSGGPNPTTCGQAGSCNGNSDCCSNNCVSGSCECADDSGDCIDDNDCCSGTCSHEDDGALGTCR